MGWGKGIEINLVKRGLRNLSIRGNSIYKVLEVPGHMVHMRKSKELLLRASRCLEQDVNTLVIEDI